MITELGAAGHKSESEREVDDEAFRALFELSPVGLCFTARDGTILRANPALCALLGRDERELRRLGWPGFVDPRDLDALRTAGANVLGGTLDTHAGEWQLLGADGAPIPVEIWLGAVRDPAGQPRYLQSAIRERPRRAEEALQRLEQVISSAPVSIFSLDPDGVFTVSLGRGLEAIGLRPGEVVGASVFDLYGDQPAIVEHARRALGGGSGEFTVELSGRHLEVRYQAERDAAGVMTGVTGLFLDVTERRQAEENRLLAEARSRFLAAMSHELRTPLNSILGFAQLLRRPGFGHLDQRQERYVGHIESSGRHLLALINDLLDLTKVEQGAMDVAVEDVEVEPLLDEALSKLGPAAAEAGLRLARALTGRPVARADRRRLLQVLLNLLSNAIKFTPSGGTVTVGARAGAGVEIWVADTGIGIPAAEQERIFEEFHQVEGGRARPYEGSGLGLALSRRLVDLMGGRIRVESRPGQGSVFTVDLEGGGRAVRGTPPGSPGAPPSPR